MCSNRCPALLEYQLDYIEKVHQYLQEMFPGWHGSSRGGSGGSGQSYLHRLFLLRCYDTFLLACVCSFPLFPFCPRCVVWSL